MEPWEAEGRKTGEKATEIIEADEKDWNKIVTMLMEGRGAQVELSYLSYYPTMRQVPCFIFI